MTDDEAAAGVAYDIHDAPSLDTPEQDRDERDAEQEAMRLRRFRRMRAMSVEPMS